MSIYQSLQLSNPYDEFDNFQVAYITTTIPKEIQITDVEVDSNEKLFTDTGLTKTSYIRLSKIFTISPSFVINIIGELPDDINTKINSKLIKNLNLK